MRCRPPRPSESSSRCLPIPTLIKPLDSVDTATGEVQPTRYERSDITSVPAASTVAEATVAYTVANEFLRKYGGDSVPEIRRHLEADREAKTGPSQSK